jgi:glycerol-3-phosphate dehydrogenase
MGRCQGGFCTSRCMKLLAERGGVPVHEITKRGGGSWMVIEMTNDQHPPAEESDGSSC